GEHTVVLVDVLGALKDCLVRKPRNIIDAYGISIMTPIVSLAEKILDEYREDRDDLFEKQAQKFKEKHDTRFKAGQELSKKELIAQFRKQLKLSPIKFEIKDEHKPFVLDWSYSNMEKFLGIGYDARDKFCKDPKNRDSLPDREDNGPNPKPV